MEKKLYWLSFADPFRPRGQQFLGGLVMVGFSFDHAVLLAGVYGKNPGGQVRGVEITEPQKSLLSPDMLGVLMTRKQIRLFDKEMAKRLRAHLSANASPVQASSDSPAAQG